MSLDVGMSLDAGVSLDVGVLLDTGVLLDVGVLLDDGLSLDAGVLLDAGISLDAGVSLDAGISLDAGVSLDTGSSLGNGISYVASGFALSYTTLPFESVTITSPLFERSSTYLDDTLPAVSRTQTEYLVGYFSILHSVLFASIHSSSGKVFLMAAISKLKTPLSP